MTNSTFQPQSIGRTCAIGLLAGLSGALAMNAFARIVKAARGGREADGASPGSDRDGRGMQPPQARGPADRDAAITAGAAVYRAVTGEEPSRPTRLWLGTAAHYALGGTAGICYALAARGAPWMRAGYGTFYGTAVWAVADEGMTPALGLSRGPRELPAGIHAYSLLGHWLYGATLEAVTRCASRFYRFDRGSAGPPHSHSSLREASTSGIRISG